MATVIRDKKPNFWQWLRIQIGNLLPIDGHWLLGLPALVIRRGVLQELNLLPAPDAPPAFPPNPVPDHRTADATGMDPKDNYAGASNTPFSRNMAPNSDRNTLRDPPVQLVAQKLLQRQKFVPAGMQLNVLAAAWIQFMTHDWMRGAQTEKEVELAQGTPQCPLRAFRFKTTDVSKAGTVKNERTHWWDTSALYGQNEESLRKIRLGRDGLLIQGPCRGVLPVAEDGGVLAGDNQNSWAGVQLLQELFLREHNAIAKCIAEQHPELRGNDEELFNKARLVVAAIAAKIHTVDWTVELLKTDTLYKGMNSNWFGLPRAIGLSKKGPPGLFSLVGKEADNHGVPFSLTEEFVAVYRLHPLIPDGLPLESEDVPISMLLGEAGEERLRRPNAPIEVWDAIMKYPCGNLSLFNYPTALRSLIPTDANGKSESEKVDLAAIDLYRDRERGIRNYNDFRRALHMKPFKNYHELTGGDEKAIRALEEVYGVDGMEKLDFLVGNLAEKKIKGFAISETSFIVFLLMASRRLESDRFLNENFNEDTYTKAGFAWVKSVEGLGDVLRRHFPEMSKHFEGGKSAFTPNTAWPEHYLQPQTH